MSPRARRILMTADTVGGVWTFALELCRALPDCDIALAAMGGKPGADQRRDAGRLPNVTLFESDYKLEWMQDPWVDIERAGAWLLSIDRSFKPDLIHLNTLAHGALPWSAPAIVTAHSCVLSWWAAVKYERAPAEWDRYRATVKRSLDAAAVIAAPSRAMLDALMDHHKARAECRVIPNGRDAREFTSGPKENFVLAAGRLWDEGKNIAALERVAPRLPWPVHLAGEGGALGRLSASELAGRYARAAIYAAPARYEPFGLSILEAALSGCALVLGDIPSLREIWSDAALWVAPEDNRQLESALQLLIADEPRRRDFAARARERALFFTPERMANGYRAAYDRALAAACVS